MAKRINNQLDIIEYIDKLIAKTESEVEEVFANRLKEILETLAIMYSKFTIKDESSYTDLNKYNRLSKELERINKLFDDDYKKIVKMIETSNERIYIEQYLMTAYLFEVYQSTEYGFSIPSQESIQAALTNPIEFLTLPSVLKNHRNEINRKIRIEITSSLLAGEGYEKMAIRISKAVGFSRQKARTVARTEGGRARSIADEKVDVELSKHTVLGGFWLSSLDHKTRSAHRKLDGQKTDKEGYFRYKTMKAKGPHLWFVASMDINCRCVKLRTFEGYIPSVRRGRDYKDADYQKRLAERIDKHMGNGYTYAQAYKMADSKIKPPNVDMPFMSYEEWLKKFNYGA